MKLTSTVSPCGTVKSVAMETNACSPSPTVCAVSRMFTTGSGSGALPSWTISMALMSGFSTSCRNSMSSVASPGARVTTWLSIAAT